MRGYIKIHLQITKKPLYEILLCGGGRKIKVLIEKIQKNIDKIILR